MLPLVCHYLLSLRLYVFCLSVCLPVCLCPSVCPSVSGRLSNCLTLPLRFSPDGARRRSQFSTASTHRAGTSGANFLSSVKETRHFVTLEQRGVQFTIDEGGMDRYECPMSPTPSPSFYLSRAPSPFCMSLLCVKSCLSREGRFKSL